MNLNNSESEGMTPLFNVHSGGEAPQPPTGGGGGPGGDPRPMPSQTQEPALPPVEEKKVATSIETKTMDSTPLADIMNGQEVMDGGNMVGPPQDPRMMAAQPQMMQAAQAAPQQQAVQAPPSKNPMNLTDEQVQALFVGVCAVLAFSRPVQDKLANFVPQFVGDNGARSTAGLAVTAMVAAAIFYFGQRVVLRT